MAAITQNFKAASEGIGQEVNTSFEIMENKETRTRLVGNSKKEPFAYIRTELPKENGGELGAWQNAHFHKCSIETWIVEKGCQIVAYENKSGEIEFKIMRSGDTFASIPGVPHNCFMFSGTITHTVKITEGDHNFDNDWIFSEKIDKLTKSIDMEKFIKEHEL